MQAPLENDVWEHHAAQTFLECPRVPVDGDTDPQRLRERTYAVERVATDEHQVRGRPGSRRRRRGANESALVRRQLRANKLANAPKDHVGGRILLKSAVLTSELVFDKAVVCIEKDRKSVV